MASLRTTRHGDAMSIKWAEPRSPWKPSGPSGHSGDTSLYQPSPLHARHGKKTKKNGHRALGPPPEPWKPGGHVAENIFRAPTVKVHNTAKKVFTVTKQSAIQPYFNPAKLHDGPMLDQSSGRLYQVKGRAWVRCSLVPVNSKVMNSGDAFVFDTLDGPIYCWIGAKCTRVKRVKAHQIAMDVRNEHHRGRGKIVEVVEPSNVHSRISGLDRDGKKFWERIGGHPDDVLTTEEGGTDASFDVFCEEECALYRVDNKNGILVESDEPHQISVLNRDSVYFFVCPPNEAYVWQGNKAKQSEVEVACQRLYALQTDGHDWIHCNHIQQGYESLEFLDKFILADELKSWRQSKKKLPKSLQHSTFYQLNSPREIVDFAELSDLDVMDEHEVADFEHFMQDVYQETTSDIQAALENEDGDVAITAEAGHANDEDDDDGDTETVVSANDDEALFSEDEGVHAASNGDYYNNNNIDYTNNNNNNINNTNNNNNTHNNNNNNNNHNNDNDDDDNGITNTNNNNTNDNNSNNNTTTTITNNKNTINNTNNNNNNGGVGVGVGDVGISPLEVGGVAPLLHGSFCLPEVSFLDTNEEATHVHAKANTLQDDVEENSDEEVVAETAKEDVTKDKRERDLNKALALAEEAKTRRKAIKAAKLSSPVATTTTATTPPTTTTITPTTTTPPNEAPPPFHGVVLKPIQDRVNAETEKQKIAESEAAETEAVEKKLEEQEQKRKAIELAESELRLSEAKIAAEKKEAEEAETKAEEKDRLASDKLEQEKTAAAAIAKAFEEAKVAEAKANEAASKVKQQVTIANRAKMVLSNDAQSKREAFKLRRKKSLEVAANLQAKSQPHDNVDATQPTIEATQPTIEATQPTIEATQPTIEATHPTIEAIIEATKPSIEDEMKNAKLRKAKAKAEQQAKQQAENDIKQQQQAEIQAKAKAIADEEAKKVKLESDVKAKIKAEEEAKAQIIQAEKEEKAKKAKVVADAKIKAEKEAKEKIEAEAKAAEEFRLAKAKAAEVLAKSEAEKEAKAKADEEAQAKAQAEADENERVEAEKQQENEEKEIEKETTAAVANPIYVILFDYDPADDSVNDDTDDEIKLVKGAHFEALDEIDESGFIFGRVIDGDFVGSVGVAPSNFLEQLDEESANQIRSKIPIIDIDKDNDVGDDDDDAEEVVRYCKVLFDFNPEDHSENDDCDDELALREGQTLRLFGDPDEDGFYLGEHTELATPGPQRGLIPSNFVEITESPEALLSDRQAVGVLTPIVERMSETPTTTVSGDNIFKVEYDYTPTEHDELHLRKGRLVKVDGPPDEDEFYEGEHVEEETEESYPGPRRGLIPSTYIAPFNGQVVRDLYRALFDYDASDSPNDDDDDELSFIVGDVFKIYGPVDSDGFFEAVIVTGPMPGSEGAIPSNFVERIPLGETSQLVETVQHALQLASNNDDYA